MNQGSLGQSGGGGDSRDRELEACEERVRALRARLEALNRQALSSGGDEVADGPGRGQ